MSMNIARRRTLKAGLAGSFLWLLPGRSAGKQGARPSGIIYPWRATTAIVTAGGSFEVWFDAGPEQKVESVELRGSYHSVAVEMSIQRGEWVYDKLSVNSFNTRIAVTVPKDAPADRYALVLKTSTGDDVSTGAVKVVREFRDHYYILQFSDAHRWQGGHDGMLTMRKVSEILKIANIIDPEIIFETGDNMYNVVNHPEREQSYYHGFPEQGILGLHDVSAATFISPGNHDSPNNSFTRDKDVRETARFFNRYYGLGVHNFTYGNGRFCMFNDAWGVDAVDVDGQGRTAAAWLDRVGRGNFVLGAAHIMGGAFGRFDRMAPVDMALVGHNHHLAPDNPHPVNDRKLLYVANAVREHFEFNLFRVNNATGECVPVSGQQARCQVIQGKSKELLADPGKWIPNLRLDFAKHNDGSVRSNTATIINRYDFPIHDAKIRFVMPKGNTYAVSKGTVGQAFDGDSVHVVDVRVPVEADASAVVEIRPV